MPIPVRNIRQASELYDYIAKKGGGCLEEFFICRDLGFSHGTFLKLRRELVRKGLINVRRINRQVHYSICKEDF